MFKGMVPPGLLQATCVSGAPPGPNRVFFFLGGGALARGRGVHDSSCPTAGALAWSQVGEGATTRIMHKPSIEL